MFSGVCFRKKRVERIISNTCYTCSRNYTRNFNTFPMNELLCIEMPGTNAVSKFLRNSYLGKIFHMHSLRLLQTIVLGIANCHKGKAFIL
jgi:hypothetical protein